MRPSHIILAADVRRSFHGNEGRRHRRLWSPPTPPSLTQRPGGSSASGAPACAFPFARRAPAVRPWTSASGRAEKKRTELLSKITEELEVHTQIENEIFYPAFRQAGEKSDDEKLFFEAREEHRAVGELVLPDLNKTTADSEQFGGRAKVIKELVEHHVKEEEGEMFPRAKKLMSKDELQALGEKMEARKRELLQQRSPRAAA
jgi:iron-sulfur cluster repair protein YtfE (RIC family)